MCRRQKLTVLEVSFSRRFLRREHAFLNCFAKLGNLDFFVSKLVAVLSLLAENALQLPAQIILCIEQLLTVSLNACLLHFGLLLEVFDFTLELIVFRFLLLKLFLDFFLVQVGFVHFPADFLAEVDISHSLLHHEVNRFDCFLDVIGLGTEEVPNYGHSVRLLRLLNILVVVLQ